MLHRRHIRSGREYNSMIVRAYLFTIELPIPKSTITKYLVQSGKYFSYGYIQSDYEPQRTSAPQTQWPLARLAWLKREAIRERVLSVLSGRSMHLLISRVLSPIRVSREHAKISDVIFIVTALLSNKQFRSNASLWMKSRENQFGFYPFKILDQLKI